MIRLTRSLAAWGTPGFEDTLRQEVEQLHADQLPLQQGLSFSSSVTGTRHRVMILSVADGEACIHANTGIFYTGVVAGCSCADDPTPIDEQNEYCVVRLDISKQTAETTVTLLAD